MLVTHLHFEKYIVSKIWQYSFISHMKFKGYQEETIQEKTQEEDINAETSSFAQLGFP